MFLLISGIVDSHILQMYNDSYEIHVNYATAFIIK
jgi:hypothetical protein